LAPLPVLSVPVLYRGAAPRTLQELRARVAPSLGRTVRWREAFEQVIEREGLDLAAAWKMCDKSDFAEGLYLKVEEGDETTGRLKWVRRDFVQAILDSDKHHAE